MHIQEKRKGNYLLTPSASRKNFNIIGKEMNPLSTLNVIEKITSKGNFESCFRIYQYYFITQLL